MCPVPMMPLSVRRRLSNAQMRTVIHLTNRILLLAALAGSALYGAEETCPWLNAATAGGVLGEPVAVTVIRADAGVTCSFARREANAESGLQIEVAVMHSPQTEFAAYKQRCGSDPKAIAAIGNEAFACTLQESGGHFLEQVVGRVRDQAFVIRLSTANAAMRAALRDKARQVAETIAGNLF